MHAAHSFLSCLRPERIGIDFGLEPSVFAHAGIGHFEITSDAHTSLGYDVGAALDPTLLPVISFGPHAPRILRHARIGRRAPVGSSSGCPWLIRTVSPRTGPRPSQRAVAKSPGKSQIASML